MLEMEDAAKEFEQDRYIQSKVQDLQVCEKLNREMIWCIWWTHIWVLLLL